MREVTTEVELMTDNNELETDQGGVPEPELTDEVVDSFGHLIYRLEDAPPEAFADTKYDAAFKFVWQLLDHKKVNTSRYLSDKRLERIIERRTKSYNNLSSLNAPNWVLENSERLLKKVTDEAARRAGVAGAGSKT